MTTAELREKALALPLTPGVYLMHAADGEIIYVGKAKKLRNRVSQYFFDFSNHSAKTRLMVSKVDSFEVIMAADEFEALILECSLIKRHKPKYNILLKDDKGFPYIRLSSADAYPRLSLSQKRGSDGADYFGPFGARHQSQQLIELLNSVLKLPACAKEFPRCIGRERPCLNASVDVCEGWCAGTPDREEYLRRIALAKTFLNGNAGPLTQMLRAQMLAASENLEFEQAARLRDRLNVVESLEQKQMVTLKAAYDTDAVGYAQSGANGCLAVLHYVSGNLVSKDCLFVRAGESESESFAQAAVQYYYQRPKYPRRVLLAQPVEETELFEEFLNSRAERRIEARVPQRGEGPKLTALAVKNASEELEHRITAEEKRSAVLEELEKMLCLPGYPARVESFDISHTGGTDIVASMVVFKDGKPRKNSYRHFKLRDMDNQDDYAAMRQVLRRRLEDYLAGKQGFSERPDLLLIDGGLAHVCAVQEVLNGLELSVPAFGMVKDNRHRTRALIAPDGREISIAAKQSVFAFIGTVQEETHRFAITFHRKLRSGRMTKSALDGIPGIGPKRRQQLLDRYKTVSAVAQATLPELRLLLNADAASAVYDHFHKPENDT